MRDLYTKIRQLSAECESIRHRAAALAGYRCAHDAYKILYFLLYDHCRRHEAHIIDFDLAQARPTDNVSTDVHFRFATLATGTPHETGEMWLAFRATGKFSTIESLGARHELGCLLGYEINALHGESTRRLPHSHDGAELNCLSFGLQPRTEVTLTTMNTVLQTNYLVSEGEILHLAKTIATAVIQLDSTPWFTTFWNSDNIVLFLDDPKDSFPLKKPHFRIRLEHASRQSSEHQSPSTEVMLFCLAIVLYELWKYFPGDKNMYEPRLDRFDDGNVTLIRRNIKRQMDKWVQTRSIPETYAEIIDWCLDAPSCTAEEMRNSSKKLNEIFERVICGLEKVESECGDSAALIKGWKISD
ncbi:hypothetical protein N7520_002633 [Penicillium odoratum]|uniref:uncharacterized protein n=1 Tax=Penicillium odoratum TaxID=1167516 RepID=UPI002548793C|nr:uncharacterized protein N7520_002633 [Penicillium odoratum]KAJ5772104.1 hypothetical protein N7520_002633 [Penicillium odoratum]